MPVKPCHVCHSLVDARDWKTHREAHHNATKPRQLSAEWQRLKRKVEKRDRYRCLVCGRGRPEVQLHVHHINSDPNDDRLENLLLLCSDHHPRGGDQPLR